MLRLLSDENFDGHIVRGLIRREPLLNIVRVQDVGLIQTPDELILDWAAKNSRVLLTHDVSTVPPLAFARVAAKEPMTGVFIIPRDMPIGAAIDEILFFSIDAEPLEWKDQVLYFPLS